MGARILRHSGARYLFQVLVLFLVYVVTAKFGLSFYAVNDFATLIWPPSGIAIAALLLYSYKLWPGVALGALTINLLMGAAPPVAVAIAVGNTLEALVAIFLLRQVNFDNTFGRLQDALAFVIFGSLMATVVSATVGTTSLLMGGVVPSAEYGSTWFAWWLGDALGTLVLTPLLLTWLSPPVRGSSILRDTEVYALIAVIVGINFLALFSPYNEIGSVPLIYLIPIPLIWSTLRFGPRGKSISLFITAIFVTAAGIAGEGPFARIGIFEGLLLSQAFVGALAIIFLFFASVVEERRRVMDSLRGYVEQLEHAFRRISSEDQAKNDFLAILAHELRNPLAPVISALELMKASGVKEESVSFFETIDSHVKNIVRLLDDLLDVSKISRKKMHLKKETLDLRTVVKKATETVATLIKEKRHTLKVLASPEPLWVWGDTLRLEQTIVNLLNNAAKYTSAGGQIELAAEREGEDIVVRVRDNGSGIEPQLLTKIFEPFVQAPEHSRGQVQEGVGLGIGLSLTKRLVELHGGTVVAQSAGKGRGSEFIVQLPRAHEVALPPGVPPKPAAQPAPPHSKRRRVLVVDDNRPAAEGIAKLLEHSGHETLITYDGAQTLLAFEEFSPDVIILDIGLPDMNGYEVAKKIRDKNRTVSLIALTGYGQSEDRLKTQNAGFAHHLIKPVAIAEVEKVLDSLP